MNSTTRSNDEAEAAEGFFENLLKLEINTITKEGMSGRKMPTPAIALMEIAGVYEQALAQPSVTAVRQMALAALPQVAQGTTPAVSRFAGLADRARSSTSQGNPSRDEVTGDVPDPVPAVQKGGAVIVRRIAGYCDRLATIVSRPQVKDHLDAWDPATQPPPDLPLTPEELVVIRKAWELGVEPISIQTVVQLDGDIITRSTQRAAAQEGAATRDMHLAMVATSVEYWKFLFQAAGEVVKAVAAGFFRFLRGNP